MPFSDCLTAVLNEPTTIHPHPGTNLVDFGVLDINNNPIRSKDGFVWLLPNNAEPIITFVGKVTYSVVGDKTPPYFSLPNRETVCTVVSLCHSPYVTDASFQKMDLELSDVKGMKAGFAIRLINKNIPEDASLPSDFFKHNEAALNYFVRVQEAADVYVEGGEFFLFTTAPNQTLTNIFLSGDPAANADTDPNPVAKPFVKRAENQPFYVVPVVSEVLFPQFKGAKTVGVVRAKGRKGMYLGLAVSYQFSSRPNELLLQVIYR